MGQSQNVMGQSAITYLFISIQQSQLLQLFSSNFFKTDNNFI